MSKKLLFFDIDGTILIHGHFPRKVIRAIKKAQKEGNLVFLNTGRSPSNIPKKILRRVHWDGWVCSGAYAELHGEPVMKNLMTYDTLSILCDIVDKYRLPTIFDGMDRSHSVHDKRYITVPSTDTIRQGFEKFGIFKLQVERVLTQEIMDEIAPYACCYPMGNYVDVFNYGCSKAIGMEAICRKLHMAAEDTVVFGDNNNDLDMFRYAKISVAMKNCSEPIARIATYRASHPRYGCAEGIQKFVLNKE